MWRFKLLQDKSSPYPYPDKVLTGRARMDTLANVPTTISQPRLQPHPGAPTPTAAHLALPTLEYLRVIVFVHLGHGRGSSSSSKGSGARVGTGERRAAVHGVHRRNDWHGHPKDGPHAWGHGAVGSHGAVGGHG